MFRIVPRRSNQKAFRMFAGWFLRGGSLAVAQRPDGMHPMAVAARRILLALACTLASAAFAGPTPAPVRAEIDALLARLQAPGCQFNRNGSWYSGPEARSHLLRKLEAIEGRVTVQSTEQFIQLAASGSSVSGKPYLVRCGAVAPVESRKWLTDQLVLVRSAAPQRP
jgi:hypothetical protein